MTRLTLYRTYPTVMLDYGLCQKLSRVKSDDCVFPLNCSEQGCSGVDNACFTSTVKWGDPPPVHSEKRMYQTLRDYLNRVLSTPEQSLGIDLDERWLPPGLFFKAVHEEEVTLTLLTTSMKAPVFVDEAREGAGQNRKSIIQKLGPITSADNDIKLPGATPSIYLPIRSLGETAMKASFTPNVPVSLQAEKHRKSSPHFNSNQSPKDLPKIHLTNDRTNEAIIISQQADKSASAHGPEPRPNQEPPIRTQQAEKSVPVPTTLPGFESFSNNYRLPKISENEQLDNNLNTPFDAVAQIKRNKG